MLLLTMNKRINNKFDIHVSLVSLFKYTTISSIANNLIDYKTGGSEINLEEVNDMVKSTMEIFNKINNNLE